MAKKVVPSYQLLSAEVYALMQKSMPIACVDLIVLRKNLGKLEILLIKRKIFPEVGKWCIIGGRILKNESIEQTIARQAKRELGVAVQIIRPWSGQEPIGVFNVPLADAQKHYISLMYPVAIRRGVVNELGPEFSEARWFPINKIPRVMGFVHRDQVDFALRRIKGIVIATKI